MKLSDRIVDFLQAEEAAVPALACTTYGLAVGVNEIARRLGVKRLAVNGALARLHQQKRVLGLRVLATGSGRYRNYAVTLMRSA